MQILPLYLFLTLLAIIASSPSWGDVRKIVSFAREQIGVTTSYDPEYRVITYPNGDIPIETGVCTDVIIRALRKAGIDLQKAVHEDMKANFHRYSSLWGLRKPDKNIDHRRVPNLMTYFRRQGWTQNISTLNQDYQPGDIVTWLLPGNLPHIGIVSDKKLENGVPLIIHNIGSGTEENDCLFVFPITGHYRLIFK